MRAACTLFLFVAFLLAGNRLFAQKTILMDDQFLNEYGQTIPFQQAMDAYKTGAYRFLEQGNDGNGKTIWQLAKLQNAGQISVAENKPPSFLSSFTGADMQGNAINSADWANKKVWMSFWSVNTPSSIDQLDQLEQAASTLAGTDSIVVLAVTLDSREKVQAFLDAHPRKLTIVPGAVKWYQTLGIKVHPAHALIIKGQLSKTTNGLMSKDLLLDAWK